MHLSTTIQRWPIDRLIPYARNARTHSAEQVAQVAASMREFGFTNPILIDSDSGVIAGHARLEAARKLSLTEVPVIVLDHLTETQKRAYILVDNRLALNAGWDDELLAAELATLREEEFDLNLLGFDDEELDRLRNELDSPLDADENAAPEVEEIAVSRPGDLWLLGPHRVLCGDACSRADLEPGGLTGNRRTWCSPIHPTTWTTRRRMRKAASAASPTTTSARTSRSFCARSVRIWWPAATARSISRCRLRNCTR